MKQFFFFLFIYITLTLFAMEFKQEFYSKDEDSYSDSGDQPSFNSEKTLIAFINNTQKELEDLSKKIRSFSLSRTRRKY